MAGSAPQGEKCGAQTHQAGHKHQAGAITALVPQGAQARCSPHPGLRNHPDSQLKALLTHLWSHSTLDLTSSSRLDFFFLLKPFQSNPFRLISFLIWLFPVFHHQLISLCEERKSKFPIGPTSLCLLSQITDDHQKTGC